LFDNNQHYTLIVLADGGVDLESFQFDATIGWKQAAGVFWQVVDALAQAEQWTSFEVSLTNAATETELIYSIVICTKAKS
jgi:uncharacterized protein (DUF849 family)